MFFKQLTGMLRLRLTVALMIVWLSVLFNIERLHKPINLASFVYVLAGLTAVAIILLPKLRNAAYVEITLLILPVYVFLKWSLGYEFLGSQLPLTVTECLVLCVTSFLASRVARQINDFLRSATDLAMVERIRHSTSLAVGEKRMYGEVQRARRFQRPLAVATLAFAQRFTPQQWSLLTEQARLEIARRFLETRVAALMSEVTDAGDIVVSDNNQFIIMFPERTREDVCELLDRVAAMVKDQLGVNISYGVAQFPHEECTLTGLIERAASECEQARRGGAVDLENSDSEEETPDNLSLPVVSGIQMGQTTGREADYGNETAMGVDSRAAK